MIFDKPIIIQKIDEDTEKWTDLLRLRASINKSKGSEYLSSGAIQSTRELVFSIRYCPPLKDIPLNTQLYRIIYDSVIYDVMDYDDFMEKHKIIKLFGSSIGNI